MSRADGPDDGSPPLDAGALGRVRGRRRVEVLAPWPAAAAEPAGHPRHNRTDAAGAGAKLGEGSAGGVMDQGGWISSTLRRQRLVRPMGPRDFRKSLERIWAKQR